MREGSAGAVTIVLRGCLDLETTAACWRDLRRRLAYKHVSSLEVDASQLKFSGSIGVALMKFLETGGMTPHARVTVRGLGEDTRKLLDQFASQDALKTPPEPPLTARVPQEIGAAVRSFWRDLLEAITFVGTLLAALANAVMHPKRLRWREIRRTMERAGADALPVVSLFSWLVGLVLALEAAHPLRKLGAELFIADLIGFSSIRDTGPLVTAIMLAGRSGSAFAAELGTMKVNQELDALTTMGLDPIQFLVLPRVLAAVLLTPLLTLYAMLMSIIGGVLVLRFFGFPPMMIYHEIVGRVEMRDLVIGMEKSVIFGLIVGAIGCLRGLQTGEGPREVGVSTTRAVVAGIILVILSNTAFSAVQYILRK